MSLLLLFGAAVPEVLGLVATMPVVTGTLTARALSSITTSGTSGFEVTASCRSTVTTGATAGGMLDATTVSSVVATPTARGVVSEPSRATAGSSGSVAGAASASASAVPVVTGGAAGVLHAASIGASGVTASSRATLGLPGTATVSSAGPVQGMAAATATGWLASVATVAAPMLSASTTASVSTAGIATAEGQEVVQGTATAVGTAAGVTDAPALGAAASVATVIGTPTASVQTVGVAAPTARATVAAAVVGQGATTGAASGELLGGALGAVSGTGTTAATLGAEARATAAATGVLWPSDAVAVRASVTTTGSAVADLGGVVVGRSVTRSRAHRIGPVPRIVVATEHPRDPLGVIVVTPLDLVEAEGEQTVRYRMAIAAIGTTPEERDAWGMAVVAALMAGHAASTSWHAIEIERLGYGVSSEAYTAPRYVLEIECAVEWMRDRAGGPDHARSVLAALTALLGSRVVIDGTPALAATVWERCEERVRSVSTAPVQREPAHAAAVVPVVAIRPVEQRPMSWGLDVTGWHWTVEVDAVVRGEGLAAEDAALAHAAAIAAALDSLAVPDPPMVDLRVLEARQVRSVQTDAGPVTAVTLMVDIYYETADSSPYRLAA